MNSETMVIESLEQYYFDEDTYNKQFVLQREAYYIKNNQCINKEIPGRTKKESNKEYYEKNKEKLNEKIDCECGGKYIHQHKSRHMKSKKHINYIEKTT